MRAWCAVGQISEDECFTSKHEIFIPSLARNLADLRFCRRGDWEIKIESIAAQLDEAVLNRLNGVSRPKSLQPDAS